MINKAKFLDQILPSLTHTEGSETVYVHTEGKGAETCWLGRQPTLFPQVCGF